MSRILNGQTTEDCKPWKSPSLDNASINDINYDFKLTEAEITTQSKQQETVRQQSYEKSYAKGYMEGLSHGKKELREQFENLQSLMATLVMPLPNLDNQVVDELVQLCMAVVKQLVRRELKSSPDEIVAVVREALSLLPATAAEVSLELHPDDAKLIRSTLTQPESESGWKIVEDPLLTPGGCRVLTTTSRIDATLEKRIDSVISEVMGGERKVDSSQ
ncbi:MAG: flagellar assembly protein FliH [Gammaproteobacteria bacterium]|nr:flagellar assembly protein FliH [Gammaproteobacteria bacterium]